MEDFIIIKVIGRGTYGKVSVVQKKKTGEVYALKSVKKEDIIEKNQINYIISERDVLKLVNI